MADGGDNPYWIRGRICFPEPTPLESSLCKKDGSYYSFFGPCAADSGIVYSNSNLNVSLGLERLTKTRVPLLYGYDQYLQLNQEMYINTLTPFLKTLQMSYHQTFFDYTNMIDECEEHHADPHLKKMLRVAAREDLLSENLYFDNTWMSLGRKTQYKLKTMEVAKPGKIPRLIGDLGVHASLQGFRLTKFMKLAMANNTIHINGGAIHFCPTPDPFSLEEVFDKLINPPGRFYFVLFSDDSCLAYRSGDKVLRFNIDISSCDASHTESLFMAMRALFPVGLQPEVDQLIDQCRAPITVYDRNVPRGFPKRSVTLKPKTPRLYSGSTLTTTINNVANIIIAHSISACEITCGGDVIKAAARTGYIVTCEDCDDWHKLQFLKHSPVRCSDGVVRPLLNIGVLLRLSGRCKGDLPGSKTIPLEVRAKRFQASLLHGAYPKARFALIDSLKANVGAPTPLYDNFVSPSLEHKVVNRVEYPVFHVPSEEVWARYELDAMQIAELECDFASCSYGDHYQSSGLNEVLKCDYGLTGQDYPDTPPRTFDN
jgi:hypothetical protein